MTVDQVLPPVNSLFNVRVLLVMTAARVHLVLWEPVDSQE